MKASIQIPKGWRRLKTGSALVKGDAVLMKAGMHWMVMADIIVSASPVRENEIAIRRVKRRRAKAAVKTCGQCSKQHYACPHEPFCLSEMDACHEFCQRAELRRGAR